MLLRRQRYSLQRVVQRDRVDVHPVVSSTFLRHLIDEFQAPISFAMGYGSGVYAQDYSSITEVIHGEEVTVDRFL
jgi:hypothetical protein